MEEVIKTVCDAAEQYDELPNPKEWKSFAESFKGLKSAIENETATLMGEDGTIEVEYGDWWAEVAVKFHITEDPGDGRWVSPSWKIDGVDYTVLDLWQKESNVSADLKLRKRLDEVLNGK